jgi:hypothetical protein
VTSVSTDRTRERLPVTEFDGRSTGKVLADARVLRRTQDKARRGPGFRVVKCTIVRIARQAF